MTYDPNNPDCERTPGCTVRKGRIRRDGTRAYRPHEGRCKQPAAESAVPEKDVPRGTPSDTAQPLDSGIIPQATDEDIVARGAAIAAGKLEPGKAEHTRVGWGKVVLDWRAQKRREDALRAANPPDSVEQLREEFERSRGNVIRMREIAEDDDVEQAGA